MKLSFVLLLGIVAAVGASDRRAVRHGSKVSRQLEAGDFTKWVSGLFTGKKKDEATAKPVKKESKKVFILGAEDYGDEGKTAIDLLVRSLDDNYKGPEQLKIRNGAFGCGAPIFKRHRMDGEPVGFMFSTGEQEGGGCFHKAMRNVKAFCNDMSPDLIIWVYDIEANDFEDKLKDTLHYAEIFSKKNRKIMHVFVGVRDPQKEGNAAKQEQAIEEIKKSSKTGAAYHILPDLKYLDVPADLYSKKNKELEQFVEKNKEKFEKILVETHVLPGMMSYADFLDAQLPSETKTGNEHTT